MVRVTLVFELDVDAETQERWLTCNDHTDRDIGIWERWIKPFANSEHFANRSKMTFESMEVEDADL